MIDTKERIARSNIYSIFGKIMNRFIDNNDDGEVLLKKAGLSSFIEEYENNSENGRMVSCDGSGDSNDMGNNFRCY